MAHLKMFARDSLTVAAVIGFFVAASELSYDLAAVAVSLSGYFGG